MSDNEELNQVKNVYKNYLLDKYPAMVNLIDSDLVSSIDSIKLTNGQSNRIYCCQFHDAANQIDKKDARVVLRFFGSELTGSGNNFKTDDTKEEMIYKKVRMTLKLPEILHSFSKGRIEEFLELQNLSMDEFRNSSDQIAKIIAEIHALNMEEICEKNRNHLDNTADYLYSAYLKQLSNFSDLKFNQDIDRRNFQDLTSFDYKEMIDWVKMIEKKLNSKIMFVHNDVNRYVNSLSASENLLTFECNLNNLNNLEQIFIGLSVQMRTRIEIRSLYLSILNYGYRWSDLSNYLIELTVERAIGNVDASRYLPEDEFCTRFLTAYLNCLKANRNYEYDERNDNLDKLRLEVDFGCIVINLVRCLWILSHSKISESRFNFLENVYLRFNLMKHLKEQFCIKYSHL